MEKDPDFDSNTSLPAVNRDAFNQFVREKLQACKQTSGIFGLIKLKVMSLRNVNTAFGYQTGDRLLAEFSHRVEEVLPTTDIIIKTGDSEYSICFPSLMNEGHIILAVNKILTSLENKFSIDGEAIFINIAMGIAIFPNHANDHDILLRKADIALGEAIKEKKTYTIFQERMIKEAPFNIIVEKELKTAIANNEFVLKYQPKVNLKNRSILGVEALTRWTSPSLGFVSPEVFIPIIEKSNLIIPFTMWTINQGLKQAREWRLTHKDVSVAVNLSAVILHDHEIVDLIIRSLNIWDAEPVDLVLEVTESAMMTDPERSMETLRRLHNFGINISIDDFGTGYSSFAYLKKLPVSELKIDKTFVTKMAKESDDANIVRTIVDLAHNFGLYVTAEGVEDQATIDQLIELDCDHAQGFYIARPMPLEDLLNWLGESHWSQKVA